MGINRSSAARNTSSGTDTDNLVTSCRAKWSPKTLSQTIWTVKDIQPGEELSISCMDQCSQQENHLKPQISLTDVYPPDIPMGPDWRWFHRQNELRDNWNFKCTCSLCSTGSRNRQASDERRAKFSDLAQEYHQLNHHDTKGSLKALQVLEKAMKINRKEPMLTSATPLLIQAAWTAYRGGHIGMAKRYVEEVEEDMKARGFDDEWEESSLKDIKNLLY